MTQEEKDLLLKDICSRLPYGVKVQIDLQSNIYPPMICKVCNIEFTEMGCSFIGVEVLPDSYCEYREFLCKPCLYPLSSMTEEQKNDMFNYCYNTEHEASKFSNGKLKFVYDYEIVKIDWCNKNNFDYRGLIELGLAIDATNLNIY